MSDGKNSCDAEDATSTHLLISMLLGCASAFAATLIV